MCLYLFAPELFVLLLCFRHIILIKLMVFYDYCREGGGGDLCIRMPFYCDYCLVLLGFLHIEPCWCVLSACTDLFLMLVGWKFCKRWSMVCLNCCDKQCFRASWIFSKSIIQGISNVCWAGAHFCFHKTYAHCWFSVDVYIATSSPNIYFSRRL